MPLTPADIHNIEFKKPSVAKRGYDEEQVDAFLDELEQELIRLIEENNDLRTRLAHRDTRAGAETDARLVTALDQLTAQLDRVRREKDLAERAAHATRAELERARTPGAAAANDDGPVSQVLTMAQRTADTHLDEAERAAHDLLSEARSTARRITGDAVAEAEAVERDAQRRHDEAMGGLDAKRTAAQRQIEDLGDFQREYRSRLRTHVESELRDVDGRVPGLDGGDQTPR